MDFALAPTFGLERGIVKHDQALSSRGDTNILLLNSVHVAGIGPINCLNVPGHAFRGSLVLAIPRLVCEYCAIAFTKEIFEVQVTEIHEIFISFPKNISGTKNRF